MQFFLKKFVCNFRERVRKVLSFIVAIKIPFSSLCSKTMLTQNDTKNFHKTHSPQISSNTYLHSFIIKLKLSQQKIVINQQVHLNLQFSIFQIFPFQLNRYFCRLRFKLLSEKLFSQTLRLWKCRHMKCGRKINWRENESIGKRILDNLWTQEFLNFFHKKFACLSNLKNFKPQKLLLPLSSDFQIHKNFPKTCANIFGFSQTPKTHCQCLKHRPQESHETFI